MRAQNRRDALRIEEVFRELEILTVSELPEYRPRCLLPAPLYERSEKIQEAFLGQPAVPHTARGMGLYHLLNPFEFLCLKRSVEAFSL